MRVALSGGIASGKTLVSDTFASLGVPVIDTDLLAREVVETGTDGLHQVVRRFGDSVLDENGALDRRQLRQIIFSDDTARKDLEAIIHPLIREQCEIKMNQHKTAGVSYCVVVIPLLVETGQHENYDHSIIVDVLPEVQLERLMKRDNSSLEQAKKIIASQASREQRLAVADDLILNCSTKEAVEQQVNKLHERLCLLAKHY